MNRINSVPLIPKPYFTSRIEVKSDAFKNLPIEMDRNDDVMISKDKTRVVLVSNSPFHEAQNLKHGVFWGLAKLCGIGTRSDNEQLFDQIKHAVRDAFFDAGSVRNLDETL